LTEESKSSDATPIEKLRKLAYRWTEEGWQKGNPGTVDQLHAEISWIGIHPADPAGGKD